MSMSAPIRDLERDLGRVGAATLPKARSIVAKGSVNVKQDAATRISGLSHAPHYPKTIGFDLYELPFQIRSRIGPDKEKRQGALGNILELGTQNNPPHPHLVPALDAEEPKLVRAAHEAGIALLESGL
jgi:hypothetical protein